MLNWERCDYDWSKPDSVLATVTDSNIYNPDGSWWELKATPKDSGSRVEMTWERNFKRTAKGWFFNFVFKHAGNRLFGKYAREIIENRRSWKQAPRGRRLGRRWRGRRFESVRGLCKSAGNRRFLVQLDLLQLERAVGMEPFVELHV